MNKDHQFVVALYDAKLERRGDSLRAYIKYVQATTTSCCSNGSERPHHSRRQRKDESIVFARRRRCPSPSNTRFCGPTRVYTQISIPIDSAVFAGFTVVTNRRTDTHTHTHTPVSHVSFMRICDFRIFPLLPHFSHISAQYIFPHKLAFSKAILILFVFILAYLFLLGFVTSTIWLPAE